LPHDLEDQPDDNHQRPVSGRMGGLGIGDRFAGQRPRRNAVHEPHGPTGGSTFVSGGFRNYGFSPPGGLSLLPPHGVGYARARAGSGAPAASGAGTKELIYPKDWKRRLTMSTARMKCAVVALLVTLCVSAQQGRGTISGTVTDAQRAPVPSVSVEIR